MDMITTNKVSLSGRKRRASEVSILGQVCVLSVLNMWRVLLDRGGHEYCA